MNEADRRDVRRVEDLTVFQLAYRLSLDVHRFSLTLPQIEQYALADQIRRASKSVCANVAEGFSRQRQSAAEYRRFLMMAIGSSDEMQLWLRYAIDLDYIAQEQGEAWKGQYGEVSKMLQSIMTRWTRRP